MRVYIKSNNNSELSKDAKSIAFQDMANEKKELEYFDLSKGNRRMQANNTHLYLHPKTFFSICPNPIIYPIEILKDKV